MFGKLQKKGKINTAWKDRWFEMSFLSNGLTLSYYQSKQNKKLCGKIEVANVYQIKAIDYNQDEFTDYNIPNNITLTQSTESEADYPKYSFILCTLGRDYILSAPNSTEFIAWIELLNKYVFAKTVFDGYLDIKEEKGNNVWNKCYFVLDENKQLKYYNNRNKEIFCGSIPLSKINKIKNDKVYDNDRVFTFSLHSSSKKLKRKSWILCYVHRSKNAYNQNLESREMRAKWQNQIQQIVGKEQIEVIQRGNTKRAQSDINAALKPSIKKQKQRATRAMSVIQPNKNKTKQSSRLSINVKQRLSVIMPGISNSNLTPSKEAKVEDEAYALNQKT